MDASQVEEMRQAHDQREILVRDIADLESGAWRHFEGIGGGADVEISDVLLREYRTELRDIERHIELLIALH